MSADNVVAVVVTVWFGAIFVWPALTYVKDLFDWLRGGAK